MAHRKMLRCASPENRQKLYARIHSCIDGIDLGRLKQERYQTLVDKVDVKPLWIDLAMAFALVAVCLRVLIPMGYMPVFGNGSAPTMVICTSTGAKVVIATKGSSDSSQPIENKGHQGKGECGFAVLGHAASPVSPSLVLNVVILVADANLGPMHGLLMTLPLRARPPPQTGPPIAV